MGTLTANVISTTYKNIVFQKSDNKIYYTNSSDVDTEITTFASPMTLSGLITATAGIKLGNNIIYASDGGAAITLDTSDNVTIGGDLTITGGNITNAITTDALLTAAAGVKLGNNILYASDGGTAITLDTSDNVTITGDLTVNGGDATLKAANDGSASLLMQADNSDDAGDDWKLIANSDQTFTFGNDKASAGSFVNFLTITPHATASSSNVTIAGDLTISGGNITNALTLDSTLAVSSNVTITGNLVFTGARDIVFTESDGLDIKDESSTYATFQNNAITIGEPMTCSGKVLLNGNTGPTAGTGITAATGEVYNSWVERYGNMIKTSIYIDMNSLQANGDQKVIGKDGGTANCHLGQITTALNGSIIGGRMTCLEEPATGDRDIDLCFDDASDGAEAADLTGETDLVVRNGDWTTSEMRTFGTIVTANNYLYLRTGTNASDATYSAGKFLIELWGTV